MSTIYYDIECDFTQIPNHIILNPEISGTAKAIYFYIIMRIRQNKAWEFYDYDIMSHLKEGRDAFRNAKKELIEYGYLVKIKQNVGGDGKYKGCEYAIKKEPITGNPMSAEPTTDKPTTENQSTNNKKQSNNINKKQSNKEINTATAFSSSLENSTISKMESVQSSCKENLANLTCKENLQVQTGTQTGKNTKNLPYSLPFQEWYIAFAEPLKSIDWGKRTKRFDGLYRQFQARLKEMSFEELMQNTRDYLEYKEVETSGTAKMGAEVFLNGKCQNDYRQLINDILRKNGKPPPVAQKNPEKQQEEVKMKEDTQKKVEAIKSRLNAKEKEFNDYIKEMLKSNYDVKFHEPWIDDFVFSCRKEVAYFGFTEQKHIDTVNRNFQKFEQIIMREIANTELVREGGVLKLELKLID